MSQAREAVQHFLDVFEAELMQVLMYFLELYKPPNNS